MNHWIVFDAMGVIFETGDDTHELLVPYIRRLRPQVDVERIQAVYLQASLGQITAADFWRLVDLGDAYPRVQQDYLDTCLRIEPRFKEIAGELSQKYSMAILSNDVGEWSLYLRQRFGLDRLFREAVISGDVGFRKPSPEIYQILLEQLSVPAGQCVFIDDRAANLVPAREAGMVPVWFQREAGSKNKLIPFSIWSLEELPELVDRIFAG
jgi:HAD superfamily hydrolase (TIGR01549 family)